MKRQKLLTQVFAISSGFILAISLGSCDLGHEHVYGDWVVTTPATCENYGLETRICTKCDASEEQSIDPLGHDYGDWVITTPATCEENGVETRTCSRDSTHIETRDVEKIGHDYGEWVATTPATCEAGGVETRTCSHDATHVETRDVDALGHDYGEWVTTTPATCTTAGVRTKTCSHDETHVISEDIAPLGHDYGKWEETTPAGCDTAGVETRVCSHDANHVETRAITPTGNHSYSSSVTREATCTEKGTRVYTCTDCGNSYSEDIAPLGHDYVDNVIPATCTNIGYTTHTCSRCDSSYFDAMVEAKGHAYGEWTITTAAGCETEGVETRVCANDASHKETRTISATGHAYGDWEVTTAAGCETDGEETRVCANDATHVETRSISATGHAYGDWEVTTAAGCVTTGEETRTCANDATHKETRDIAATGVHNYSSEITKDPTCTEPGTKVYTCADCDSTYTEDIPATGHTYGTPSVVEPTCTTKGYTLHSCVNCDYEYLDSVLNATGHTYTTTEVAVTCVTDGYTLHTCISGDDEYRDNIVTAVGSHTFTTYTVVDNGDGTVAIAQKCEIDGGTSATTTTMTKKTGASYTIDLSRSNPWVVDADNANKYTSASIGSYEYSYIVINITSDGVFAFDYGVSSEKNYDKLNIRYNSDTALTYSGDSSDNYITGTYEKEVKAGDVIEIYYAKDRSGDYGQDNAYIILQPAEIAYYALMFNSNGGTAVDPMFIEGGAVVGTIGTPTREGYYFEGWYVDEALTTAYSSQVFSADTTLYAKWSEPLHVTLINNDGTANGDIIFQQGTTPVVEDITRDGYYFLGWYTDDALTSEYEGGNATASFTLYARWMAVEDAYALYGSYAGFKVQSSFGSAVGSYAEMSVDVEGNYSLRTAYSAYTTGTLTTIDSENGTVVSSKNGTVYYDSSTKTIIIVSSATLSSSSTVYVLTKDGTASSTGVVTKGLNSGKYGVVSYSVGGVAKELFIDVDANKIYFGVDIVDLAGAAVNISNIATYNVINFVVKKGDTIIGTYGKSGDSSISATLDGYQGTYTSSDDKTIQVSGAGKAYTALATTSGFSTYEVVEENVIYLYYSSTIRYLVTLDKVNHTFTYAVRTVTVTFDYGYEEDGVEKVATQEFKYDYWEDFQDQKPTRSGYIFEGWYDNSNFTGSSLTRKSVKTPTTYYAKWSEALTLTLNYNNGEDAVVSSFSSGTTPDVPSSPTRSGYLFVGWYTDAALETEYVSGVATSDVTLYAAWEEAPYYVGTYYYYNEYSAKKNESKTASSTGTISESGSVTGKWSTTWSKESYVEDTHILTLGNSSAVYFYQFADGQVIATSAFSTGSTSICATDMMIYAKTSSSFTSVATSWDSNYQRIVELTISGKTYLMYIDARNNVVYCGISLTTFDGTPLAMSDVYDSSSKSYASELVILGDNGVEIVRFKGDTSDFTKDDGKTGTYTGTIDGVTGNIVLDGYGDATITIGEAVTTGTYTFSSDGTTLTVTDSNRERSFTVADKALTQVLDGIQGTYTIGEDSTLVLTGWGDATLDGEACTYTNYVSYIEVQMGENVSYYTLDKTALTAKSAEKSIFAGLTFTGTQKDNSGDSETIKLIFDDDVSTSGIYWENGNYWTFEFTGVYDESTHTLVITITSEPFSGTSMVDKTFTFSVESGKLTCTASDRTSGIYKISLNVEFACETFVVE